jgi:hypothetical protein
MGKLRSVDYAIHPDAQGNVTDGNYRERKVDFKGSKSSNALERE